MKILQVLPALGQGGVERGTVEAKLKFPRLARSKALPCDDVPCVAQCVPRRVCERDCGIPDMYRRTRQRNIAVRLIKKHVNRHSTRLLAVVSHGKCRLRRVAPKVESHHRRDVKDARPVALLVRCDEQHAAV